MRNDSEGTALDVAGLMTVDLDVDEEREEDAS